MPPSPHPMTLFARFAAIETDSLYGSRRHCMKWRMKISTINSTAPTPDDDVEADIEAGAEADERPNISIHHRRWKKNQNCEK